MVMGNPCLFLICNLAKKMKTIIAKLLFYAFFTSILLSQSSIKTNAQWTEYNTGINQNIFTLSFANKNTGLASSTGGLVVKTSDGGATWTRLNLGTTNVTIASQIVSENVAYVGSYEDGIIYKTTDGGNNWQAQNTGASGFLTLNFVAEPDANIGFAAGDGGTLVKTTDGGDAWTVLNNTQVATCEKLYFLNKDVGFAAGSGFSKTTDGGITWTKTLNTGFYWSMFFVDANTGFLGGQNNSFLKTTDGGDTWQPLNIGVNSTIYGIHFFDVNTGYITGTNPPGGGNGLVLKTTDGGTTWERENLPPSNVTSKHLNAITFIDTETGYVAGAGGRIIKYQAGTNTVTAANKTNAKIYPNPATSNLVLSNVLPNTKVSVTNIFGNTLLETTTKNSSEVNINVSALPKGVYIIRITSGNKTVNKKLVIEK